MDDVPPAGVEAAFSLIDVLRRHARPAPGHPHRRPHRRAAGGRGRRRPPHRRRDHGLPVPHGRRRQRDHHQAPRQRLVLGVAEPRPAGHALRGPRPHPAWIEETLRYDTSSQMLARVTTEAVELHDVVIPAGERVVLIAGSANRDGRVFRDPDAYDLGRSERELQQIASFGFGRHFCLGASLARLEARVCPRGGWWRGGRLRHRPGGDPPRALRQRPGLRRPPPPPPPPPWSSSSAEVRTAPRAARGRGHGLVVGPRPGHRAGARGGRPPRRPRRGGSTASRRPPPRSSPTAARRSGSCWTSPTTPRSTRSRPPPRSGWARSRSSSPTPVTCCPPPRWA